MDQNLNTDAVTLTKTLCGHLAAARFGDLSAAAQREARRGVLDWIGCALAGSGHPHHRQAARRAAGNLRQRRGDRARPQAQARPARRAARQRPDGPRARFRRHPHGRRGAAREFAGAGRAVRAGRARGARGERFHARLCGGFRGRRPQRPHRARPSQGRLASDRHARHHRGGRRRGQADRARRPEADLRDGHCRDPGRRHAAEPRHHVQVVPRRQGRPERRAGGAARRARLRQHPGDHRGPARLLPRLQRHRGAGAAHPRSRRQLADREQRP